MNIVFVYYDMKVSSVVHKADEDDRSDTLCRTAYGFDNGEFLHEDDEYEKRIAENWGVDLSKVTCKRCLKRLARG